MRNFSLFLCLAVLTVFSFNAPGQEAAPASSPSPTPKTVSKPRSFDQFDLKDGVKVYSSSGQQTTGRIIAPSANVELVDKSTHDGIGKLVSYFGQIETEYRSTDGQTFDSLSQDQPERALSRKLNAAFRITKIYSEGLLDQVPLKNDANQNLLADSQTIIVEALAVAAVRGDWTNNERKLSQLSGKYNADGIDKRKLLTAMLGRLNETMSRLKNQIAIKP